MTDTPQTDRRSFYISTTYHQFRSGGQYCESDFARTLELEVYRLRSQLAEARECLREAIEAADSRKKFFIDRWRKAAGEIQDG